ncbi:MAG: hypothetical protein JWO91_458 [Acidobacteriaceae bacterium]|nr:hypothetical protein [Acidobacteriaceae bacterium]
MGVSRLGLRGILGIPVKANIESGGKANGIPEFVDRPILFLRLQSFDHALPPHGHEFFHERLVQHEVGPPWSKYSAPRTLSWVKGGEPGGGGDKGTVSSEFFKIDFTL